jgi:hypothetical protein
LKAPTTLLQATIVQLPPCLDGNGCKLNNKMKDKDQSPLLPGALALEARDELATAGI